jgi:hypothetical protein
MKEIRSILLLLFLFPAVSLAQTIHKDKDKIVYKGKIKVHASANGHDQSKSFLLEYSNPDSIKEEKDSKHLSSIATAKLPSPYHLQRELRYKVKFELTSDGVTYEIEGVELLLHERGEKEKILSSADLLKGMDESGNASRDAEKVLNEIDMYIQQYIVKIQSAFSTSP